MVVFLKIPDHWNPEIGDVPDFLDAGSLTMGEGCSPHPNMTLGASIVLLRLGYQGHSQSILVPLLSTLSLWWALLRPSQ